LLLPIIMSHDIINLDFDFHILILLVAINLLSHQVNKLKLLCLLYLLLKKAHSALY
jgi:hypothetical protein